MNFGKLYKAPIKFFQSVNTHKFFETKSLIKIFKKESALLKDRSSALSGADLALKSPSELPEYFFFKFVF